MRVIDPGHCYQVDSLDGGDAQRIVFVKREGAGYPGNVGSWPGTNCQELIRVLIDRVKYLQGQIACPENELVIDRLRSALRLFEERAAQRHGREFVSGPAIEAELTCAVCGHIHEIGEHTKPLTSDHTTEPKP
jgi:hypothetical protein